MQTEVVVLFCDSSIFFALLDGNDELKANLEKIGEENSAFSMKLKHRNLFGKASVVSFK